MPWIRKREA